MVENTDYRLVKNGNMLVGLVVQQNTILGMMRVNWENTLGMMRMQVA